MANQCRVCNLPVDAAEQVKCVVCDGVYHGVKCVSLNKTTVKAISDTDNITYTCDICMKAGGPHIQGIMSVLNKHSGILEALLRKVGALESVAVARRDTLPRSAPISGAVQRPLVWPQPINNAGATGATASSQPQQQQRKATGAIPKQPVQPNFTQDASARQTSRPRNPLIIGTGRSEAGANLSNVSGFKAAPRRQWLYIGRVSPGTAADDIINYVNTTLNIEDVKCDLLSSTEDICSFKLGVKEDVLKTLLDPGMWPAGVAIKEFIPRRRPYVGAFQRSQLG